MTFFFLWSSEIVSIFLTEKCWLWLGTLIWRSKIRSHNLWGFCLGFFSPFFRFLYVFNCLWTFSFDVNILSRWRMRKKWKYIYVFIIFLPTKERHSASLLDKCNSKPGTLGSSHRLTRHSTHGTLLPSVAPCLGQLVTSSVPKAVLDSSQIPRAKVHERWLWISRTTSRVSSIYSQQCLL